MDMEDLLMLSNFCIISDAQSPMKKILKQEEKYLGVKVKLHYIHAFLT